MHRLVQLVLLALVALKSNCNELVVNNESDLNHQLDNSTLSNHTCQTPLCSEHSEPNLRIKYLEAKITELTLKLENLKSKSRCCRCRNVTVFGRTFEALYDSNEHGNDWIVIQHRFDGSVDFYRNWTEYRNGFGSMDGEFWLGLEHIHMLTSSKNYELLILLEDFNGVKKIARYEKFAIGGESIGYNLKTLGSYNGTAGDSLEDHKGQKFSTFDRDHDLTSINCAEHCKGAWWYRWCADSNLNGLRKTRDKYRMQGSPKSEMYWSSFNNDRNGLKTSKMMIREV